MKLPFLYFISLLLCCMACKRQANTTNIDTLNTDKKAVTTQLDTRNTKIPSESLIENYLSEEEIKHLLAIKAVFDSTLCFNGTIETLQDCYLAHAQVYSYDVVKQVRQVNESYPYNTKFDLSQLKQHANNLDFLTLNCGFQQQETGETFNYYCLKNKGVFMDYLGAVGKNNSLIATYQKDYTENKRVKDETKKRIGALGQFELDFTQFDHQVFYLFYHLMINEEVQTIKKVKAN